jgi:hypothetical protein
MDAKEIRNRVRAEKRSVEEFVAKLVEKRSEAGSVVARQVPATTPGR